VHLRELFVEKYRVAEQKNLHFLAQLPVLVLITVAGSRVWNTLSEDTATSPTLSIFRQRL